jgi:hypothetical protein
MLSLNATTTAPQAVSKEQHGSQAGARRVRRELELHAGLRHRHIVQLLAVAEDDANTYLVLERCSEWLHGTGTRWARHFVCCSGRPLGPCLNRRPPH